MLTTDKGKVEFRLFDTMSEFAAAMDPSKSHDWLEASSFRGGITGPQAVEFAKSGNEALAAESDAYLSKLESLTAFESSVFRNLPAVAGGVANVPAYLAGQPMAMRQRRRVIEETAPIDILVNAGASWVVEPDHLVRRGSALLALVRLMSIVRPVRLFVFAGHSERGVNTMTVVRIETAPLDLARAAFALTSPAMLRRLLQNRSCQAIGIRNDSFEGVPLFRNADGRADVAAQITGSTDYIFCKRANEDDDFRSETSTLDWLKENLKSLTA
jgi:hypothetical protein